MSSFGHRGGRLRIDDLFFEKRGYKRWPPYFQSKLANILFTLELHRRLDEARQQRPSRSPRTRAARQTDLGFEGKGITNIGMRPGAAVLAVGPRRRDAVRPRRGRPDGARAASSTARRS